MRLEIKENNSNDQVVKLFLKNSDNEILLVAENSNGNTWNLLAIDKKGIILCSGISSILGFPLDSDDSLIIHK